MFLPKLNQSNTGLVSQGKTHRMQSFANQSEPWKGSIRLSKGFVVHLWRIMASGGLTPKGALRVWIWGMPKRRYVTSWQWQRVGISNVTKCCRFGLVTHQRQRLITWKDLIISHFQTAGIQRLNMHTCWMFLFISLMFNEKYFKQCDAFILLLLLLMDEHLLTVTFITCGKQQALNYFILLSWL